MNKKELLNCPFCDCRPSFDQTGKNQLTIKCPRCCIKLVQRVQKYTLEWLEEKMIETWNTRVSH